jgi:hypothetical protein
VIVAQLRAASDHLLLGANYAVLRYRVRTAGPLRAEALPASARYSRPVETIQSVPRGRLHSSTVGGFFVDGRQLDALPPVAVRLRARHSGRQRSAY